MFDIRKAFAEEVRNFDMILMGVGGIFAGEGESFSNFEVKIKIA